MGLRACARALRDAAGADAAGAPWPGAAPDDAVRTPSRWGIVTALGAVGTAVGLAAEHTAFGWADAGDWVPDLLAGWTVLASGLVALLRRPGSAVGPLLVAAGFAWFVGNFAQADWSPAAWLGAHLLYLHRGPLIQSALAFPTGRPAARHTKFAVLTGYLTSAVTPLGRSNPITLMVGLLVAASAIWGHIGAVGRDRRARAMSLPAAIALGLSLAAVACLHLAYPVGEADPALLAGYEAVLAGVALSLALVLISGRWERASLTDLVVALSEDRSGSLRDALGRALGDPSLQIGYRLPDSDRYVDAEGRPVAIAQVDPQRGVTPIDARGRRVAILVHDAAVVRDAGLIQSVSAAAELAASNARLQAEVRAQLADLSASRRRLVDAGDAERQRLEQRLRAGAEQRLTELAISLDEVREHAERVAADVVIEPIDRARERIELILADLRRLAGGLHPRLLAEQGLAGAVDEIAVRVPLPVTVDVSAGDIAPDVAAAAYFVCAEALSNIEKHSRASRCAIRIERRVDRLLVVIADDGTGGADIAKGSGLRGLADRVDAMGGVLTVRSAPETGTTVVADLPLDR